MHRQRNRINWSRLSSRLKRWRENSQRWVTCLKRLRRITQRRKQISRVTKRKYRNSRSRRPNLLSNWKTRRKQLRSSRSSSKSSRKSISRTSTHSQQQQDSRNRLPLGYRRAQTPLPRQQLLKPRIIRKETKWSRATSSSALYSSSLKTRKRV